jgi:hypothetical protein
LLLAVEDGFSLSYLVELALMAANARLQNLHVLLSLRDGSTTGAIVPANMPAVSAFENRVMVL